MQNICLLQIDELLVSNGNSLKDFSCLPQPIRSNSYILENRFLIDELSYDRTIMSEMHESLYRCLTAEQLNVYENIMTTVHSQVGGFIFLIWIWWNRKNIYVNIIQWNQIYRNDNIKCSFKWDCSFLAEK